MCQSPAGRITSLSSFVPASPAHSHHGFSDSQRGVSDEPESSPRHDPLPALPSTHLLLPVSLAAKGKPLGGGGSVACHLPPAPLLAPSPPLATRGIVVRYKEELLGVLSSGELGQVVGSTFLGAKRVLASGLGGRERNGVPGGREVGWVTSPVSLPPSDGRHPQSFAPHRCLAAPVWGSQSQTFLHPPWLKAGFPHHWKRLLLLDPPSCLPDPVSWAPVPSRAP